MTPPTLVQGLPTELRLADLTPYLSITVLEHTGDDPAVAFESLRRFLRTSATDRGRAVNVVITAEVLLGPDGVIDDLGRLEEFRFARLYGVSRVLSRAPSWADKESGIIDTINQLTIALQRNNLVAVHSDFMSQPRFTKWVGQDTTPFRLIPPDVFAATFRGDAKMLWTRGVHRRRITKADTKALGGMRIQDALDPIEDGSFAMTAAKVNYQPDDPLAVLRDNVTFSDKSRLSCKPTTYFAEFLKAVDESLDLVEKSLAAGDPSDLFPYLAIRERNLDRVRGAFDIMVADPDQVRAEPNADDELVERAELLQDALLETRGFPDSAVAHVDVGENGVVAGTLTLKPVPDGDAYVLTVGYTGPPSAENIARKIKHAIQDGDLLTVYYESGHAFTGRHISRPPVFGGPFPNIVFEDFTGYEVTKEKPKLKGDDRIHAAIASNGDDSLFAWVVDRFGDDWLLCDDGAGEIADFLHLDNNGMLTAIHVKAADNRSLGRRIAVTRFEQVVSQAEKSVRLLDNDALIDHLSQPRAATNAVWHAKVRTTSARFVDELRTRTATDKTRVAILQPHLLEGVYDTARASIDAGQPNRDARSLLLLDNLLHSTRRTVTGLWDDLFVIGCT